MCSSTKHWKFSLLVLTNMLGAWYYTCLGPLIPYYSAATGLDQTHFSYLFIIKTFAILCGGQIARFLLKRLTTQNVALIYMSVAMVTISASTFSLSTLSLSITLFIATLASSGTFIIALYITIKMFMDDQPEYWVQILQYFFVIGAFAGQYLVGVFQINSLLVLGLAFIIPIIGILVSPLPDMKTMPKEQQTQGINISARSKLYICMVFFFIATVEMGIGSWMPTYSIKAGVTDVDGSSMFGLLYWGPDCLVKLLWIYFPGSIEKKLGVSLNLVLVASIASLFFQQAGMLEYVCYFAPISIGICISGVYGFCLSWVFSSGFAFCPEDNGHFLLLYIIGEGLLIMPMGYAMGMLGFKSLIVMVCIFALLAVAAFVMAVGSMEEDKCEYQTLFPQEKKLQKLQQTYDL